MIMSNHNPHHTHHHHTHLHHTSNLSQPPIKTQTMPLDSTSSANQSVDTIPSKSSTLNSDSFVRVLKNSIGKSPNTMGTPIQSQQQQIDKQRSKPTFHTQQQQQQSDPVLLDIDSNSYTNTHTNSPSLDPLMTNQNSTVIPTKLYVTNFPFTCTQRQIQELFNKFGQVVECTLKKDYYAYIQYTSTRDAQAAFKNANGIRMLGRKLTVHLATSKKSQSHINHSNTLTNLLSDTNPNSCASSSTMPQQQPNQLNQTSAMLNSTINSTKIIHVRNFPESCSHSQIREYFKVYGEISECLILHDSYAFVHYKHAHEARVALQSTNNTFFLQNNLLVQYSRSKFKQQTQQSLALTQASQYEGCEAAGRDQMSALAEMVDDLAFGEGQQRRVNGIGQVKCAESKLYSSNANGDNVAGMCQENAEGSNNFGDHLETFQDKNSQMLHDNETSDAQFMWETRNNTQDEEGSESNELNSQHELIPERPAVRTKLYVTNFPEDMDQDEMKQLFNNYGNVLECTIMWNQYAFVHFGSYEEAEKALMAIKGIQYKGCKISVQWSTSAKYQQPKQHASNITLTQSSNNSGSAQPNSTSQKSYMNSSQSSLQHEFSKASTHPSNGEQKQSTAPKKILERPAQLKSDPASLMSKQINPQGTGNTFNAWGNTSNKPKPSPDDYSIPDAVTAVPTKLMAASNSWASIMNNSTPILDSNGAEKQQSIHTKSNSTQSATSCSKSSSGQFKISFSEVVRSSSNTVANTLQTNTIQAKPEMKLGQQPIQTRTEPVLVRKIVAKNSKEGGDLLYGSSDIENVKLRTGATSSVGQPTEAVSKSKLKKKKELGEEIMMGNEPTKVIENTNTTNDQNHCEHKTKTVIDPTSIKIEPASSQQQKVPSPFTAHVQQPDDLTLEPQSTEYQHQGQKTSTQSYASTSMQYHQQQVSNQQPLLEAPITSAASINPLGTNFIPTPTSHFMDSLQNPQAASSQQMNQYKYNQYQQQQQQANLQNSMGMYSNQTNGMDMYGQQNRAISSTPSSAVQQQPTAQMSAFKANPYVNGMDQKQQQQNFDQQPAGYVQQQQQVAHTFCHPTQGAYFPQQQQQQVYSQQIHQQYQRNAQNMSTGNVMFHQQQVQQQQQQQQLVHPNAFSSNPHPHSMQTNMHGQLRNPQIMNQNVFGSMNGTQQQAFMQHHHNQFSQSQSQQQSQSQVNSWMKAPCVIENAGYNSVASTNQSHSLLNGHVPHMNSMYNSFCQFQPINGVTNNSNQAPQPQQQSQLIASQILQNNCLNHQQPIQNQHPQFHTQTPNQTTTQLTTSAEIGDDLDTNIKAQSISPIALKTSETTTATSSDQMLSDSLPFIGTTSSSNFIKVSATPIDTLDTSNASSLSPSLEAKGAIAIDGITSKIQLSDISSEVSSESSSSSSSSKSSSSFLTTNISNKSILSSFNNYSNYVLFPSGINFDFGTPASQQMSHGNHQGNPIQRQPGSGNTQQAQQQTNDVTSSQNSNPNYFPIEDVLANLIR